MLGVGAVTGPRVVEKLGVQWTKAKLVGRDMSGEDLRKAHLRQADLRGAKLANVDLSGANLYGAQLQNADLTGANLSGADISFAYMEGTNFTGANMTKVDAYGTDMKGANLTGANLRGAELDGADLTDANLANAQVDKNELKVAELTNTIRQAKTGRPFTRSEEARAEETERKALNRPTGRPKVTVDTFGGESRWRLMRDAYKKGEQSGTWNGDAGDYWVKIVRERADAKDMKSPYVYAVEYGWHGKEQTYKSPKTFEKLNEAKTAGFNIPEVHEEWQTAQTAMKRQFTPRKKETEIKSVKSKQDTTTDVKTVGKSTQARRRRGKGKEEETKSGPNVTVRMGKKK